MVEKLSLPFPYLSDPDRSRAIGPYGLSDPDDKRMLSRPALVLVSPEGEEALRFVSRDYADRMPEEEVLEVARRLGLPPAHQPPPEAVDAEPGPRAMPFDALLPYFRGARFAVLALERRFGHLSADLGKDVAAYVEEMDRYSDAVRELRRREG